MMVYSDSAVAGEEEPIQVRKKHKSAAGTYYIFRVKYIVPM